ncbi:unnamed protein product, partial [Ectocarpus fasciculatus]
MIHCQKVMSGRSTQTRNVSYQVWPIFLPVQQQVLLGHIPTGTMSSAFPVRYGVYGTAHAPDIRHYTYHKLRLTHVSRHPTQPGQHHSSGRHNKVHLSPPSFQ